MTRRRRGEVLEQPGRHRLPGWSPASPFQVAHCLYNSAAGDLLDLGSLGRVERFLGERKNPVPHDAHAANRAAGVERDKAHSSSSISLSMPSKSGVER